MNSKTLSIIVSCYNSEKTIELCIKAILQAISYTKESLQHEVIVVNDGSTDKSLNILETIKGITIVNHNKNQGLSSARNSGIKKSNAEYIAFIDSDILIAKDWFTIILKSFDKDNSIVGITGNLICSEQSTKTNLERYLFSSYRGIKKTTIDNPLSYKWFVFSNTIIKKDTLEQIGYFDENLKHYGGEDTELAIRISQLYPDGIRKEEKALASHLFNKTLKQYLNNMFEYGKYNFYKIINKHPDYKQALGGNIIHSFWGYLCFNPITRLQYTLMSKIIKHPLLIKLLVIDSFVRGVRQAKKNT